MKQYLAIDIGGTSVKLGIVDEEGRVLAKAEQSVCFDYYETPILTTVLSASEQFLKEQDVRPQGLAGLVHIFNPQLILIGGGVSAQQELLIEPIARKVRASIMPAFAEGLEIRAAQLHNDAGMVGAVYYFRQSRGEN